MCVMNASALNDNDETLAFLRAVLHPADGRAGHGRPAADMRRTGSMTQSPRVRSASGIPLIVGVAVSITIA